MAKKMKQVMSWFLVVAVAGGLTGCASVQRKFTRKPKEPKHVAKALAFEEGPYQKKFSNDYYYKSHYTYWKAWHGEWIDGLGGNRKKSATNASEALSHLDQLSHYLKPEKAKELEEPLAILNKLRARTEIGQYSEVGSMRVELERWRRIISSNFYYEKVKDNLLSDVVDLGEQPPAK